jgi:hypothetical protein
LAKFSKLSSTINTDKERISALQGGTKTIQKRARKVLKNMEILEQENTAVRDENSMLKEAARQLNNQIKLLQDESDACQHQLNSFAKVEVHDALNERKIDKQNNDADAVMKVVEEVVTGDAKNEKKRLDKATPAVDDTLENVPETEEEDVLDTEEFDSVGIDDESNKMARKLVTEVKQEEVDEQAEEEAQHE